MQSFYLYRLSFTGVTVWKYVRADHLDQIGTRSENLMTSHLFPECLVHIFSRRYGNIVSEFDCDSTLVPGLTRYGRTENHAEVFALQWKGMEYMLNIRGCLPIHIFGNETVTFVQEGKEIARIESAPAVQIIDEYTEADRIKRLEIEAEFIPVLEMIGSFVELRFAY